MWVRQCDLDGETDFLPPIPARIASNEEFVPPPQSDEQKEYEARLAQISEQVAQRQGRSRREFLRSGSGMAAALLALNQVFGDCYEVDAEEVEDPQAFEEKWPKDQFVFDVQTHHVDVSNKWYDETPTGRGIRSFFLMLRPEAKTMQQATELLNRAHYVKEVFGDSDTVMAVISGVPSRDWDKNPLPPDQMVATRKFVNDLAGSRRVLSHGLLRPNLGKPELEEMERQVKDLKIDAWKMYTGAEIGEKAWRMDDEKVAYPFWEKTKALGVKNLCVHKGLPLGAFNEEACRPLDLEKAAQDWPDLNFIVYHSAFRGYGWLASGTGIKVVDPKSTDPQQIPWISDILRILKRNPKIKNIYFELGSTFGILSSAAPRTCMHMLGQMVQVAGADHILWGTDSIWNGSPQSQIERMRRFKIADDLIEKYGYPQLTGEVKDQILGLNAARLLGVDHAAARKAIKGDKLSAHYEAGAGMILRREATLSTAGSGSKTAESRRRPLGRETRSSHPMPEKNVPSNEAESGDPLEQFKKAFRADQADQVREIVERHPELKAEIYEPSGPFDSPAIVNARSRAMLDVLLAAGADLNAKSRWWAGGFGLLHQASPELAAYAIERGAVVDVHAAARLGMLESLRELISHDPALVHARGGDGQTPLHFASRVDIASYLLDQGADIDARDVDHESTPAQYMVDDRQEVARYLVSRGCQTDILMATAVGDLDLVRRHLDANPDCIRMQVSNEFFPMINKQSGGTIYQWTLGFYVFAHQVARKFGHEDVLRLLFERSPETVKLIVACWLGDEPAVQSLRSTHPNLADSFSDSDRRQAAHAARNNDPIAVRLMLECGLPVDARGQHQGTPLHWAAFHGNVAMATVLLDFNPPLEAKDADFNGTPLGWAIHGSENGWYCRTGDYGATVAALIRAGAKLPATIEGSEAVRDVLRRHMALHA